MSVVLNKAQTTERLAIVLDGIETCKKRLQHPAEGESCADSIENVVSRLDALGTILSDTLEHV